MEKLTDKEAQDKTDKVANLAEKIVQGDQAALARAITLIESTRPDYLEQGHELVERCLQYRNPSIRIGITGVPGVGKSLFIERFGSFLTERDLKVAVLAIDPSSTLSKGSILGDKTRMTELANDPRAFIRPSPTGGSYGGVGRKTRESSILCEAAGYDIILIETVGVGQNEVAVSDLVDFFLLMQLGAAGDELQGIKRGIMEMADMIVINKAEGAHRKQAQTAKNELQRALHLYPPKSNGWEPQVTLCSALKNEGIEDVWRTVQRYLDHTKSRGYFDAKRRQQNKKWLTQHLDELLRQEFEADDAIQKAMPSLVQDVMDGKTSPFKAAEILMDFHRR